MIDRLWILDKGGYPIYSGNPIDAVVYFKKISARVNAAESECPTCGNVNPDQILQIVETKNINEFGNPLESRRISPEEWFQKYQANIVSGITIDDTEYKLPKSNFKIANVGAQFFTFGIRNLLSKITNRQYLLINFLEAPCTVLVDLLLLHSLFAACGIFIVVHWIEFDQLAQALDGDGPISLLEGGIHLLL